MREPTEKQISYAAFIIYTFGLAFPKEHSLECYQDFIANYDQLYQIYWSKNIYSSNIDFEKVEQIKNHLIMMKDAPIVTVTHSEYGVKTFRIGEIFYYIKPTSVTRHHKADYNLWLKGLDYSYDYQEYVGYEPAYNFYTERSSIDINEKFNTKEECIKAIKEREHAKKIAMEECIKEEQLNAALNSALL